MAELIVTEFVTLDGVMEAPGGEPTHPHSGWALDHYSDEYGEFKMQETMAAGSQLLGRVTYESFAGAWPQRSGPFAEKFNSMPKYVVTSTLDELEWENSTRLEGDVAAAVRQLKEDEREPILVAGSQTLVHTLLEHDLVDRLTLMVFPVVLGSGKRVFPDSEAKLALELVDSQALPKGVLVNTYRRPA
ncbi:MAG TPA: dihydrofolate reductase family protein [Solirubrobacterales bacterium]|nr:dihydrofolate reductase family protein [Solirubrobacterales bacterium]